MKQCQSVEREKWTLTERATKHWYVRLIVHHNIWYKVYTKIELLANNKALTHSDDNSYGFSHTDFSMFAHDYSQCYLYEIFLLCDITRMLRIFHSTLDGSLVNVKFLLPLMVQGYWEIKRDSLSTIVEYNHSSLITRVWLCWWTFLTYES